MGELWASGVQQHFGKMGIKREGRWSRGSQPCGMSYWKVAGALSLRHLDCFVQERLEEWSGKPGKRDLKHITTLI